MNSTSEQLRTALDGLLEGLPPRRLTAAVERLMAQYRAPAGAAAAPPRSAPILRDRADVAAYAAYRMPATFAAVRAALRHLAARLPGWTPAGQLDIGGGTGAAVWAAAGAWPGEDGRRRPVTVLDWAGPALELGRELAAGAADPVVRGARWQRLRLTGDASAELPGAELVTVSYVLGELPEEAREALAVRAARAAGPAGAVVLVEPGTPDGYRRIRAARERLLAGGMTVLAPCPHGGPCPIGADGRDWCHFAARTARSALHRRVKGAELAWEDEKFSYVAAAGPELAGRGRGRGDGNGDGEASGRIVRRPQQRKGQVLLDLCTAGDGLRRVTVTRRDPERYRAARDTAWGDRWPRPGG
ncbi:small ribosomal subunit Rsm22 family protein [Streptomyces aidingensis]|uniref:Ribosomal protein RSM22 (Predicted rRNA methylase) n=1 Tax=Streptomyces aidingensis TaxID=910347 RepID=A0A1I1LFF2_9ACTN|nr:small ribosomal subunit Rsm22 family protein [Streptomyces aidingensis]SFC68220.1 Ribosomal protein RSM22 (predicted rRNA methylase) [Streptomyces aidingensis]